MGLFSALQYNLRYNFKTTAHVLALDFLIKQWRFGEGGGGGGGGGGLGNFFWARIFFRLVFVQEVFFTVSFPYVNFFLYFFW